MKTASNALVSLLNSSDQFLMADLFTITTRFGEVLRYTTSDIDVRLGSDTFTCSGPLIKRGVTRCVLGLEVDTLDMTINAGPSHLLNGALFIASALSGALDGATVLLQRAFFSSWADPLPTAVGAVTQFTGRVSDVDGSRTELKIKVKSDLELLNIKMPRVVFQPACSRTLFDSGCGVSKAGATTFGKQVVATSTRTVLKTNLYGVQGDIADGSVFDLGTIIFTSGPNTGISRTVKYWIPDGLYLSFPLPNTPQIGDTFNITKGCPKTMSACQNRFNNLARFRGFPFVPAPETIT